MIAFLLISYTLHTFPVHFISWHRESQCKNERIFINLQNWFLYVEKKGISFIHAQNRVQVISLQIVKMLVSHSFRRSYISVIAKQFFISLPMVKRESDRWRIYVWKICRKLYVLFMKASYCFHIKSVEYRYRQRNVCLLIDGDSSCFLVLIIAFS